MTNRDSRTGEIRLADLMAEMGFGDCVPESQRDKLVPREPRRPDTQNDDREVRATKWLSWGVPAITVELIQDQRRMRETQAMQAARAILQVLPDGRIWGLLAGGLGAGKSTAAGWWLTAVRSSRGTGRMFIASADVAALPLGSVHSEQRIDQIAQCNALVLDDIGVRDGVGDTMHPTVQRILTRRYDARLPTLCTSNMLTSEWPRYLADARLVDRWNEIGIARVTKEPSLRGRTR